MDHGATDLQKAITRFVMLILLLGGIRAFHGLKVRNCVDLISRQTFSCVSWPGFCLT